MFIGIFTSIIPYIIAAGFSILYLLAAVFHTVKNDCLNCKDEVELDNKQAFTSHNNKIDYQQPGNFYLDFQTVKKSGFKSDRQFLHEINISRNYCSSVEIRDKCLIIDPLNNTSVLTELFYRPPPVS